jgi:exodeoxyribonuclease VII large subunit
VDWTLADFAADVRAPTPSAAAELAVRVKEDVRDEVAEMRLEALGAARDYVAGGREGVAAAVRSYGFRAVPGRLDERRQRVDEAAARASRAAGHAVAGFRGGYVEVSGAFRALSPAATLERGYNVAGRDGRTVKRAAQAGAGERLTLHFADGRRAVDVVDGEAG